MAHTLCNLNLYDINLDIQLPDLLKTATKKLALTLSESS